MALINYGSFCFCTIKPNFLVHFVLDCVCIRTFAIGMAKLRNVNFFSSCYGDLRKYSLCESDLWKTQILISLPLNFPRNSLKTVMASLGLGMKSTFQISALGLVIASTSSDSLCLGQQEPGF